MNVSRLIELNHIAAPPPVKPPKAETGESFHDVIAAAVQSKQPKAKTSEHKAENHAPVNNEKPVEAKTKDEERDAARKDDTPQLAEQVAQTPGHVEAKDKSGVDADSDADGDESKAAEVCASESAPKSDVAERLKLQAAAAPAISGAAQPADEKSDAAVDANAASTSPKVAETTATVSDAALVISSKIQEQPESNQADKPPATPNEAAVAAALPKPAKRVEPKNPQPQNNNDAPARAADPLATFKVQAAQANVTGESPAPKQAVAAKPVKTKTDGAATGAPASDRPADPLLAQVTVDSVQPVGAPADISAATTATAVITPTSDSNGGNPHAAVKPAAGEAGASAQPGNAENEAARLSEQATRALRSVVNQKGGSVTLRLTPPELGALRVRVEMSNSLVSAHFEAESEGVRSMLQQNLSTLRSALESQGLTVQNLHVQISPQSAPQDQSFNGGDDGRSRGSFDQQRSSDGGSSGDEARQRAADRRAAFEQQLNLVA